MRKASIILLLLAIVFLNISFMRESLREIYSRPNTSWPSPSIETGVTWKELSPLLSGPVEKNADSLKQVIQLGRILFFDPRISGSLKISCASCHQPAKSWTDGQSRSAGHEGAMNKRNAQTILNSWFYSSLFWDGRSSSLEDQAFSPINSESEMHGDMRELPLKLKKIAGYPSLFSAAFGDAGIDPDRIATALATFQRTIVSAPSKFDRFLQGEKEAMSNGELRGLHLFRTKARCMNCHNGPMLTDNQFHNNGFHDSSKMNDRGRYNVTHIDADLAKFRTPSLRDVKFTGPWMHNGSAKTLESIIEKYNKPHDGKDPLIISLKLTRKERADLLAFLNCISAPAPSFNAPILPQ